MTRTAHAVIISAAALTWMAAGCTAEEKAMKTTDAPTAVQTAVQKVVGTNKVESVSRETEDGKTVFEVEFEVDGVDHSADISEAGEVLEEETEVKVADLPAPVSAAVLKAQPLAHVKEASMVKAAGKSFYEVDAKVGKDKHELQINADGSLISDKVEAKEKDEKDGDAKDAKGEKKEEKKGEEKDKD